MLAKRDAGGSLKVYRARAAQRVPGEAPPATVELLGAPVTAPPPWKALAPYEPGSEVASSWSVHSLSGIADGSAILTLRHMDGRDAQLRLVRRGLVPIGVAQTGQLDLLLVNGARGSTRTEEGLARVIRAMAAVIDSHEAAHPSGRALLASLKTPPAHYC
ncbi:MAG: hypothetical protein ABI333_22860 [bacterium]